MPRTLNIDRAARFLIHSYGDECAKIAYQRLVNCQDQGDHAAASAWRLVMRKVVDLHFRRPSRGRIH